MIADIPAEAAHRIEHVRFIRAAETSRIYSVGPWVVEIRSDGITYAGRPLGEEFLIIRPEQDWGAALAEHRVLIERGSR